MPSIPVPDPRVIRLTVPTGTAPESTGVGTDAGAAFLAALAGLFPMQGAPATEAATRDAGKGMQGEAPRAASTGSFRKAAAPTGTREPADDVGPSTQSDLPSTLESWPLFHLPTAAVGTAPQPARTSEATAATGAEAVARQGDGTDAVRLPAQAGTEGMQPQDSRRHGILPAPPVMTASLPADRDGAPFPHREAQPPAVPPAAPSAPRATTVPADTNIPATDVKAGIAPPILPSTQSSSGDVPFARVAPETPAGSPQGTENPGSPAPLPAATGLPGPPGVAGPKSAQVAGRAEDRPEGAAEAAAEGGKPGEAPRGRRPLPAPPETPQATENGSPSDKGARPDVDPPKDIGTVAARGARSAGSQPAPSAADAVKDSTVSASAIGESAPNAVADGTPDAIGDLGGLATVADAGAGRTTERAHPHATVQTLPQHLGRHLAETAMHFPDRPVELVLSPEELGRVRMTLHTEDRTLALVIQADRPETIDLMRRNIDQLAQDFRDLGFTDVSFSFGQGADTPGDSRAADETGRLAADPGIAAPAAGPAMSGRTSSSDDASGLDLRL